MLDTDCIISPFFQILLGNSNIIWYIYLGAVELYLLHYSFDWYEVTQTTAFRLLLLIRLLTHKTSGPLDVSIYVITQPDRL